MVLTGRSVFHFKCLLFPKFRLTLYLKVGTSSVYEWLNFKMFCLHCRIWYTLHWEAASLACLASFPADLPSVMQALLSHDLNSSCYFYFKYGHRALKHLINNKVLHGKEMQYFKIQRSVWNKYDSTFSLSVIYMPLLFLNRISFSLENI